MGSTKTANTEAHSSTDFCKNIFELILRLKGNYLWPAMWSSMFYLDDAKNGPTATEYGVYMGTSHHEPMARADKEQNRFLKGFLGLAQQQSGSAGIYGGRRDKIQEVEHHLHLGDARVRRRRLRNTHVECAGRSHPLATVRSNSSESANPSRKFPQAWVMYKEVPRLLAERHGRVRGCDIAVER